MGSIARFRLMAGGVAFLVFLEFMLSLTGVLGTRNTLVVDDGAQFVGAWVAAALAWWKAYRAHGPCRWWRFLIGCSMASWGTGQALWSWYQLQANVPIPSPSLADAGYLLMPVFALPALLILATRASSRIDAAERANWRRHVLLVFDGLIVVLSMVLLAWQTTLAAVVHDGAPSRAEFLIGFGYPVTDLVLVAMVILLATFRRIAAADRLPLLLLALGLVCISASDSVFSYLVSSGAGEMPPVADIGFVAGPALIALSMLAPTNPRTDTAVHAPSRRIRWPHLLLPYLPLTGCVVLFVVWTATGSTIAAYTMYLGALVLFLVMVRQLITLLENTALLERVREGQARLAFQAFHDPLTGLPNRALFGDRLEHATQLHKRDLRMLALIFVDLDDFKDVNDHHGHHVGDQLLKAVGERLLGCVRSADTVARLGGDEFAILLEGDDLTGDKAPEQVSNRILAALARPFLIDGTPLTVSASLGMVSPDREETGLTVGELLRRADNAMYAGKRQGKGRVVSHRSDLETARDLLPRLAAALTPGQSGSGFEVFYQPIVRLADQQVVAVEALVRWRVTPTGAYLSPAEFVPVLERAGLAHRLDTLVLDRACADLTTIEAGLGTSLDLHVNVSATWAGTTELSETVRRALTANQLGGAKLVLELTETGETPDPAQTARNLNRLRSTGIRIALDDFGTGFNNLALLSYLDVDMVKLDRTMTGIDATGRRSTAHQFITEFGRSANLTVVAEGVESGRQAAVLTELGYELGQGYLFGRPVPLTELRPATGDTVTARAPE
ncbi:MAG: EAL domain-containing protein [Actinocatenispora sp.]